MSSPQKLQSYRDLITIPDHRPIKVGTLSGILADIAAHHRITRDELLSLLF